jgi:hypothetical protein
MKLDSSSLGSLCLAGEIELGGLCASQQTDEDAYSSRGQVAKFVSEPVTATRPRHCAEAPAPAATDREQSWSHMPPRLNDDVDREARGGEREQARICR